jgi:DNA polymerase-3 subunit beta
VLEGEPIEIAFNSEYLLDALDVIETEGVQIQLSGQLDPAVVRPVDQDDYLCVLMPMQLKEEVLPA